MSAMLELRSFVRVELVGSSLLLGKVLDFLLHFYYANSSQDEHGYVENNQQQHRPIEVQQDNVVPS